jgi:DNA modification methylase
MLEYAGERIRRPTCCISRLDRQADREPLLALDLAPVRRLHVGRHPDRPRAAVPRGADSEDEKHVHPLQLDVIDRCVELFSNKGEKVFTPFMGVGSEVYSPVILGRKGIGAELKASYYRQALKNVQMAAAGRKDIETSEALDFEADESEAA